MEEKIENIVEEIQSKGSEIDSNELVKQSVDVIKKDLSLEDSLKSVATNVKILTEDFLSAKNANGVSLISGISSCIYLPDFSGNGEFKLKLIGGSKDRNIDLPIDENTLFDIASISKVYTLLLLFKLEELGLIDLNSKIVDVNPDFSNLEDFTFNDLIRLHGEINTDGRVDSAKSYDEAYAILKTSFLKSNSRDENKYTDIGAIIMSKTLEKVISEKLGKEMSYSDIMEEFLLKPLGLKNTVYNPTNGNTTGSGNLDGIVHDPKARLLGGAVGSAGIFTNSDDLARLAHNMYSLKIVNKNSLARMGQITFPNSAQAQKGSLGMYVKHPLGLEKTYTPSEFSTGSFSMQGWTGPVANFDMTNLIHQNILVNALYDDGEKLTKPAGFGGAFDSYLGQMTKNTMIMLVVKTYYNRYCIDKSNVDITTKVM